MDKINILPLKSSIAAYTPYHQISVVMLLQGFGLIYSALYFNLILPAFILFLTIGNLLAFVIICVKEKETGTIKASAPQFILFAIVLILIVLGLYRNS